MKFAPVLNEMRKVLRGYQRFSSCAPATLSGRGGSAEEV